MEQLTNLTFTKIQIWSTFTVTNSWGLIDVPTLASPTWYVLMDQS